MVLRPLYIHKKRKEKKGRGWQQKQRVGVRDIIAGHLGLPLGQPPDTPRIAVGHVPEARARSIQSPRSSRPYLLKDSSLSLIYLVPQSCPYSPLSTSSPYSRLTLSNSSRLALQLVIRFIEFTRQLGLGSTLSSFLSQFLFLLLIFYNTSMLYLTNSYSLLKLTISLNVQS